MRKIPPIVEEVGFDFDWDNEKVWALELPVEDMDINELIWHFDVPFLRESSDRDYDLQPKEILRQPEKHRDEYLRTMSSDLSFPIDIMYWRDRWVILDGLHRLMKASIQQASHVKVRKVPQDLIPAIAI